MGAHIDASRALEWGMVNEVLPREQLLGRAWEIAERIVRLPRTPRRLTHQLMVRPWKRELVDDQLVGLGPRLKRVCGAKGDPSVQLIVRPVGQPS